MIRLWLSVWLSLTLHCYGSLAAQEIPQTTNKHFHLRGSLNNSKHVFEDSGKGHVAFIGGSITQMNGYRPMVAAYLEKQFPNTEFTFTNAGISSTCSMTGAHRLQRDVLSKGSVDLLFIEFAVNDDQDAGHDLVHALRGMEGLIVQARRHNPNADIVVTHFANTGMMETIRKGEVPISIAAHNRVCQYYQVPTNDLCSELTELIDTGKTTWELYGGVHPKPYGNAICTAMIKKILEQGWSAESVGVKPHVVPEMPLDQGSYMNGRLESPAKAKHDEYWKVSVPNWKDLKGSFRSTFAGQKLLHGSQINSQFTYTFTGQSLGVYVLAGPDAGAIEVKVVGQDQWRSVNLFHRHSLGLHYPRTVMLVEGMKPGTHQIQVRISVARDSKSQGSAVRILNFAAN